MKTIVFLGDSIAAGQGVSILESWPVVVGLSLQSAEVKVLVSAVNGETSRDVLYRLEKNVLSGSQPPDVLFVQYGINDANFWESSRGFPRVSLGAFVANLEEIIQRSSALGIRNIVLATNHPVRKALPDEAYKMAGVSDLGESVMIYNSAIRELVSRTRTSQLFDAEELFTGASHLLQDGVHLNVEGHRTYASAFIKSIGAPAGW